MASAEIFQALLCFVLVYSPIPCTRDRLAELHTTLRFFTRLRVGRAHQEVRSNTHTHLQIYHLLKQDAVAMHQTPQ